MSKKPAARVGDHHTCPDKTGKINHIGGPIADGSPTVTIDGLPAARQGDQMVCVGPPDKVSGGSSSVFIDGKPAARMGDQSAHGGVIVGGSGTVTIGDAAPDISVGSIGSSNTQATSLQPASSTHSVPSNSSARVASVTTEPQQGYPQRVTPQPTVKAEKNATPKSESLGDAPLPSLVYNMALSCSPEAFTRYTRLAFYLGEEQSTDWQYEPTSEGFRTFTQLNDASSRSLTVCQRSLATQLGHECVYPTPSHSSKATEGYLAVIPTIQHGDQLGQPTQGYYYHFQHGKLIHEYKLMGESRCDFFLTRSTSHALSDELMTGHGQRAIAVFWLQNSNLAANQHLVYLPEKLTDLNGVNQVWLDKHGLALDVSALIKAGQGNPQDNPRYHHLSDCTYDYPARYLNGTKIVALHQRHVEPGLPVVNLREEKIFRIGVFFDGTGNNDDNDQIKEDRGDKSRTNVARLFAAYPYEQGKSAKIYVSGVGTLDFADPVQRKAMVESGEDEEKITQATGRNYLVGSSGAMFKWQRLLRQLRQGIDAIGGAYDDITHIAFDVIGFSRGAALSRHFVNAIYQGLPDYTRPYQAQSAFIHSASDLRGDLAIKPHLLGDESYEQFSAEGGYYRDDTRGVSVRFLGLFDTVGSFSLPGNKKNEPFQLALAPSCAKMVLQLTASHEYRRNFPLTSILSRYPRPSKNFFQEAFPGAHADVGGGYPLLAQHDKQGLAKHFGFPINNSYNRELVKTARFVLPYTHFTAKDYSQQQIDKLVSAAQKQWQPQCMQQFGQYGEVKLKGDILYYYRFQPVCCALAGLSLERMKQQGGIAGVAWNERAYQQSLPADYLSNKLVSELSEKVNSVAIGKVDHHLWSRAIESMDAHLVHRSHDTAVSHGYDSIVEELIHGVSKDSKGNLARNVWHND